MRKKETTKQRDEYRAKMLRKRKKQKQMMRANQIRKRKRKTGESPLSGSPFPPFYCPKEGGEK